MSLFLWKLSQNANNDYDTYDSAIVVAGNSTTAKRIHPSCDIMTGQQMKYFNEEKNDWCCAHNDEVSGPDDWANLEDIAVTCVGKAADWLGEGAVVCASFNAG